MKHTILDDVLIEEYNRMENLKLCFQDKVASGKLTSEREAKLLTAISLIEFDQKKIRAALDVAGINIEEHLEPRRLYVHPDFPD